MTLEEKMFEIAESEIEDMTYDEALYFLDNDAVPSLGSVSGLIYYADTEPIAIAYHNEILNIMEDLNICRLSLNDMAWLAWDYCIFGKGEAVLKRLGIQPEEEE
jgi:hypothetical protein